MRKGSMLAGLRPRDDESETELDDEEAPESEAPKPPKTRAAPSQKGVPKPSPEARDMWGKQHARAATRALDLQIFSAADLLEVSLGRTPTHAEIAAKAKVPGPTDGARRQRVSVAMRRRGLLDAPAKPAKPARIAPAPAPVAAAPPVSAQADQPTQGVRVVEALRDRLRGQLAAVEVTLAALRGES